MQNITVATVTEFVQPVWSARSVEGEAFNVIERGYDLLSQGELLVGFVPVHQWSNHAEVQAAFKRAGFTVWLDTNGKPSMAARRI